MSAQVNRLQIFSVSSPVADDTDDIGSVQLVAVVVGTKFEI